MGESQSKAHEETFPAGAEMSSTEDFSKRNVAKPECSLEELSQECRKLKNGCAELKQAIDDLFGTDDETETTADVEKRLQSMTLANQSIVKKLVRNLEIHAKQVHKGADENERFMLIVKALVSAINDYMTMLICNIRKLKRLITEIHESNTNAATERFRPNRRMVMYNRQKGREANLIYDVISEHQDVDAMLLQLVQTERQREDLERDIVTVLVFWRDYRYVVAGTAEEEDSDLEDDVKEAADMLAVGLAHLNYMTPDTVKGQDEDL